MNVFSSIPKKSRIVVAMSGGVDSSTAAAWLAHEGYDVIGISLQVWDYSCDSVLGTCCAPRDFEDARRVAEKAGFPYYVLNFEEEFRRAVIDPFVQKYARGETPNPCVDCNNRVKFSPLFRKALALGADYLATGHYAIREREGDRFLLRRSADPLKDQSYFLFGLTQEQLARTLFPLGGLQKRGVRQLARELGLSLAEKDESQDICFIPDGNCADFVSNELRSQGVPPSSGPILLSDGTQIGRHEGIHAFTIGQRKGLKLNSPEPYFVVDLEPTRNAVIVGREGELYRKECIVKEVNWIVEPHFPLSCEVQIRYRHRPARATITPAPGATEPKRYSFILEFETPQKAVTPGQAAVFYQGDLVLGGGWISR